MNLKIPCTTKRMEKALCRLLILMFLTLAGCAFQPLYETQDGQAATSLHVRIAPIADRSGQILRTHLQNTFARGSSHADYVLKITLSEELNKIGIRNAYETRANLRIRSQWQLLRADDDALIAKGQVLETGSYDIIINDYANLSAQRSTRKKLLRRIANLLAVHIRVALDRRQRS